MVGKTLITDVHVQIFWRSYSDIRWEFTREIEEEKFEFSDAIYTCVATFLSSEPKIKIRLIKQTKKYSLDIVLSDYWKSAFKMASEDPKQNNAKK